jgi:type II secretory pathway component GspD/PulD (secretin)
MSARSIPVTVLFLVGLVTQATAQQPEPAPGAQAEIRLVTRVYPVGDLINPLADANATLVPRTGQAVDVCATGQQTVVKNAACPTGKQTTLEDQLIQLIVATIQPQTWSNNGGRATIDYYPMGMALVINQTPDAQEQIAGLLAGLRRLQDVEVTVETRVLTVSDACMKRLEQSEKQRNLGPRAVIHMPDDGLERVGIDFEAASNREEVSAGPSAKVWFLNDIELFKFLEVAQADRNTTVLQAPKMTLANGQASTIDGTEKQFFITDVTKVLVNGQALLVPRTESIATGLKLSVQPVVSADRRYVKVRLVADQANVASPVPQFPIMTSVTPILADGSRGEPVPFTQYIQQPKVMHHDVQNTLAIPDGGTAVLSGWTTQREVADEFGPPILSKIPYVNRLFKNVGYGQETEHVLLMVTPRIVIHAEEEQDTESRALSGTFISGGHLYGRPEREEKAPSPTAKTHASDPAMASQKKVAHLLEKYHQACAEGRLDEAKKLARRALTLDPACFDKQDYAK